MKAPRVLLAGASALLLTHSAAAEPAELGVVRWERNFEAGIERARSSGRPLFLLFQEVPGCSACVDFGQAVLSEPLLVEAIETEFVPVAVYNNRGGDDAAVLRRFGEPAWNNPVVRFVDADGRDLIGRESNVYSRRRVAARMVDALQAAGRLVPGYLELLAQEGALQPEHRVSFATHCFWEGEACAGLLPGVVGTRASWLEGREVVEAWFDPSTTDREELGARLKARGCTSALLPRGSAPRPARDSDQTRFLRASDLSRVPLTRLQKLRVNSALRHGGDPLRWVSPRQRAAIGSPPS